jgi:hypothetical protein
MRLQGQKEAKKTSIMLSCSPIRSHSELRTADWHDQRLISGSWVDLLSSPDLYTDPETLATIWKCEYKIVLR